MRSWIAGQEQEMLRLLEKLVNIDSGSYDKAGVDTVASELVPSFEALGFAAERVSNETLGDHWVLQSKSQKKQPEILLSAHLDTVFPSGTARERPFRIEGQRAYGPGVIDMKASLITLLFALRALANTDRQDVLENVLIILNSDEEIGSPTSKALIESHAHGKKYALVMEPARSDGSIVSSRRGCGRYTVTVQGKAAHTGINPEAGCHAIEELAHKIIALQNLNDHDAGISISVGKIEGGEALNVIPAAASALVDIRTTTQAQGEQIIQKMKEICAVPHVLGTKVTLSGGMAREPMELNELNQPLLDQIMTVAQNADIALTHVHTGGGSDASFSAGVGVATIDGMGPVGGGAHSDEEYLEVASLTERCFLLAEVIHSLTIE